jgi:hypothetical protein
LRRIVIVALVTACMVVMGAGVAFAGEVAGNGTTPMVVEVTEDGHTILHGKSSCAFSGLNDTYTGNPEEPDDDGFTRTQSWGQVDKAGKEFLTSIGVNPGNACNPTRATEGPPEG